MKIVLEGFRCHVHSSFEFPNNRTSLLSGDSGAGKSTIFSAIYWCLFGKLRNIYNKVDPGRKCKVTLTVTVTNGKDVTICRQKRPDQLTVDYDGKVWSDIVAQKLVDQLFGGRQLWLTTSYIQQSNRCELLTGTQKEKLAILKTISLGDDNPEVYITKIDMRLATLTYDITNARAVFDHSLQQYQNYLATHQIKPEAISAIPSLPDHVDRKRVLETTIRELHQQLLHYRELKGRESQVTASLQRKKTRLDELLKQVKDIDNDRIRKLEQQIVSAKIYLSTSSKIEVIKKSMSVLEVKDFTLADKSEYDLRQLLTRHHNGTRICEELHCPYRAEDIQRKIEEYRTRLAALKEYRKQEAIMKRITVLRSSLVVIPSDISSDILETKIQSLEQRSRVMQQSLDLLLCPCCDTTLRLVGGKLHKIEDQKPSTISDINTIKQEIRKLVNLKDALVRNDGIQRTVDELSSTLSSSDVKELLSEIELETYIRKLSSVMVVIIPDYTIEDIRVAKECRKLEQQLSCMKLDPQHSTSSTELSQLEEELVTLKHSRDQQMVISGEISHLQREIESLSSWLITNNKVLNNNPEHDYDTHKQELDSLTSFIQEIEDAQSSVEQEASLKTSRSNLERYYQSLTALNNLRDSAIKVEYKQLHTTVDNINIILEKVLATLFDEPIRITLSMFKTLKKGNRIKPNVNISVEYRGIEYDSVNSMSGGEGDRISLAMIMALNMVSNSQMLLLDECLSSLNSRYREAAVTAINKFNKTTIVVDHESVEGLYATVVNV